jgi:hypothetical protein
MNSFVISALPILISQVFVPLLTFTVTYTVSYMTGNLTYPDYFLSSSINTEPASGIGTFGLCITSLCLPLVSIIHYQYIKQLTDQPSGEDVNKFNAIKFNKRALITSFTCTLGAIGVGSFQSGHYPDPCSESCGSHTTHVVSAVIFFTSGLLNSYYIHQTDIALPVKATAFGRGTRKIIYRFNMCMIWRIAMILASVWETNEIFMFMSSMSEISIFLGFLCVYATFYREMSNMKVVLHVERN